MKKPIQIPYAEGRCRPGKSAAAKLAQSRSDGRSGVRVDAQATNSAPIRSTLRNKPSTSNRSEQRQAGPAGQGKPARPDKLIAWARERCELFHTPANAAFARVKLEGHHEVYALDSTAFDKWLNHLHYKKTRAPMSDGIKKQVKGALAAVAQHDGLERDVHLRVALHKGTYFIDLGDKDWRAVEVDSKGWRIVTTPRVMFVRSPGMRALPDPVPDKTFKPLLRVLNIPTGRWVLILAWLIESLRPDTAYVGLELSGPQGAAKSSTQSILRDLIDPNAVNLRSRASSPRDAFATAKHNHVVGFENVSDLSQGMQDCLCTMLTGGGFAGRTLFTNDRERGSMPLT